jgi:hypothetical protein
MESYYIIKSIIDDTTKYYYVNILEDDTVLVGGIKMKCVNILIDKINKIAVLELLQHHFKCSLFSDLQKGDEVKDLLKNSLNFVITHYPDLEYIELIDNSFITCANKKRISLPDITFIKYNKTWYENYFNVIPSNDSKDTIMVLKKQLLKILNKKLKLNYEDFINKYYLDPVFHKKNRLDIIKNIYKKNMTLKDFLDKLQDYDCIFYEKIFNNLISTLLNGTKWIIPIKTIQNYGVNSEITETKKIKDNNDLNKLFKKLNKLNIKELNQKGGNFWF